MGEKIKQAKIILEKLAQIQTSFYETESFIISPEIQKLFKPKEIFALLNVFSKRNPDLSNSVSNLINNISAVYSQNRFSVVFNKATISFDFINKYPDTDNTNHIHRFWNDCYHLRKYFPQKKLFNAPVTFYHPPETRNIESMIKFFKLCNVLYDSIGAANHSDDFKVKVEKYIRESIIFDILKIAEDWRHYQVLIQILVICGDKSLSQYVIKILSKNLPDIIENMIQEKRKPYLKYIDMLEFEYILDIFNNCDQKKLTQKQYFDFFYLYSQKYKDIRAVFFLQFINPNEIDKEQRKFISEHLIKFNCLHLYPQFATKEDIKADFYLY